MQETNRGRRRGRNIMKVLEQEAPVFQVALLTRAIFILILLGLSSMLLLADFELTHWKYFKVISVSPARSKGLVTVPIDDAVVSATKSLGGELRVIEGPAAEVPFRLIADRDEMGVEKEIPVILLNKGVVEGKYQQFICDTGRTGETTNRVLIRTSSRNFVRRADIDGSDDLRHWLSLAKGLHLFDWPEGQRLRLEFPDATTRYLKVILWLDRSRPIEIEGAAVSRIILQKGRLEPVAATLQNKALITPEKFSEWRFDFGNDHPLVDRCLLDVANPNFRRRVEIAWSADQQQWSSEPASRIFRSTSGNLTDESTVLDLSTLNLRYLRMRVFNGDDRPLEVNEIRFQRFLRQVVFENDPAKSYRLFYANSSAGPPRYDLAGIEPGETLATLPRAALGPQQANPDFIEPLNRRPWTERHPAVLWTVMIVVVVLLGGLMLRSVRSVGTRS